MASGKQRYKRLQVENIWVRTGFEIAAIIFALVVCCVLIVSGYEDNYEEETRKNTVDSTIQIAHSISGIADSDALSVEDEERRAYLAQRYSDMLDGCFSSDSTHYSGAVYSVTGEGIELFSQGGGYTSVLTDKKVMVDAQTGELVPQMQNCLQMACSGIEMTGTHEDVCMVFVPVMEDGSDMPFAVVAVSAVHRDSLDYNSIVKTRLIIISVISSVLIVCYYLVSAALSERKKKCGEAVSR